MISYVIAFCHKSKLVENVCNFLAKIGHYFVLARKQNLVFVQCMYVESVICNRLINVLYVVF